MASTPENAPFGPYVPAEGGPLECTIFVKAAPERSQKYGETVCTAAILDDGRLIRLYPIKIDEYWKKDIPKYRRVRIDAIPSDERAGRPESHKVQNGLQPIDSPLRGPPAPWPERMAILAKAVKPNGMQGLRDLQKEHRTSLGIVKVKELRDFYITAPLNEVVEQADYRVSEQTTITGEAIMEGSRIDKVKHVFRFTWLCEGACCGPEAKGRGYHDTTCEDWELFESFRAWRKQYPDDDKFLDALKNKFYDCMGQSNLHFAMGTPSDPKTQDSWMVVGLVYPGIPAPRPKPSLPTIATKTMTPRDILRPDKKLDQVIERRLDEAHALPAGQKKLF